MPWLPEPPSQIDREWQMAANDRSIQTMADMSRKRAEEVQAQLGGMPLGDLKTVWYDPWRDVLVVRHKAGTSPAPWLAMDLPSGPALAVNELFDVHGELQKGAVWVPIAHGTTLTPREKTAATYDAVRDLLDAAGFGDGSLEPKEAAAETYSKLLRSTGELAGYLPGGQLSWALPGVPLHLSGMLGGGLLGAGVGYGLGYMGSKLLPRSWNRGRLPKTLAMAGAAMGAAPGVLTGFSNLVSGQRIGDDSLLQMPPASMESAFPRNPTYPNGMDNPAVFQDNPKYNPFIGHALPSDIDQIPGLQGSPDYSDLHPMLKRSASQTGYEIMPLEIPVDDFRHVVWNDPRVAGQLPVPLRAAATGLLDAAYLARESRGDARGGVKLVTPYDVALITAGMGTGYLSGAMVGKVLGTLLGAPAETQDRLKNVGMWAGVVRNIVPLAFGR